MAKEYNFQEIEKKWHEQWTKWHTYEVGEDARVKSVAVGVSGDDVDYSIPFFVPKESIEI